VDVKRLRILETENGRLKKMPAERFLIWTKRIIILLARVTFLVLCACSSASSVEATKIQPTDQAKWERAKLQHEKLRTLIAANSALETTKQHQLQHLQEKYRGVDFTTIFHLSDLTTIAGINRARQRLDLYGAMAAELDAVVRQYWDDWERTINSNDLDEPLAGALRSGFSRAKPEIAGNYADWVQAMRGSSAAVSQLLNVAQRHLGQLGCPLVMNASLCTLACAARKSRVDPLRAIISGRFEVSKLAVV
jgi:hypothetical protein